MNRTVNLRAVLIVALAVPSLFVGVHFLHAFQMKRGASDLLEQADRAAAEGRKDEERQLLHDYLGLMPNDPQVQARYGRSLREAAHTRDDLRRAYRALARAVDLDATLSDVRREAATAAADSGLISEAQEHATALHEDFPDDGEAECLLGRCAAAHRQYDEAVRWFEAAEKHAPAKETAYLHHAVILREHLHAPEGGDDVIRRLSATNPDSVEARLTAARYFVRFGQWKEAEDDVAFVTGKPGGDGADVYLLASALDEALGRAGPARARLAEGLKRHSDDPSLNLALARLDLRAGHLDDARASLHRVAESADASPAQLSTVGELFLDLDDVKSAEALARGLEEKRTSGSVRLLARLRIRDGNWGEARVLLERLRADALPAAEARQVELLLGSCYEHLDDPEAALAAYRRALRADPLWVPACRGEISALLSLGKLDEAEQTYRKAAATAPELNLGLAQLLLLRQLRLPAAERQWSAIEAALARLPEAVAKGPEAERVRSEMLSARGKKVEARKQLEAERDRHPDQVAPWLALARFDLSQGNVQGAVEVLKQAQTRRGKDPILLVARIELAARGEPVAARKAIADLEPGAEQFTGSDRARVLRSLAEAYFSLSDAKRPVELWKEAAKLAPQDLDVRLRLLETAYRAGDVDAIEQQLPEIRNLEGAGGGLAAWAEAARRVILAEKGDRSQLAEARRRLNEARTRRPRWAPVAILEARIALLEGDGERATDQFVQAVRFGEREPAVIRAAVDGLYRRRRFTEARDLLHDCAEQTLATPDLGKRAAELTLMQAGAEGPARQQAFEQARHAVPANSTDPHDYQWLAQVARAAGEPAEAEKLLRKALSLAEKAPDTWLALIQVLAGTDVKKAEAALAEARGKITAEDAPFVLGPGYEMIGQVDKAREQYDALVAHRPNDPPALQVAADFYARRGPAAKADSCLRALLQPDLKVPDTVRSAARRELALVVVGNGSYQKFREAISLLDEGVKPPTREDELTRAVLLTMRPEKRREARTLLERLAKDGPLPPEEQFVLARLMDAEGDTTRADDLILNLLGTDAKNPNVIAWHVQSLLRRGQAQTARPWVDALKAVEPDSLRTVSMTARVTARDGRTDEATRLLLDFLAKHADSRRAVALVLEDVGATAEAEKLLREEVKGPRPDGVLVLAEFLARHRHVSEALTLCADAWKTCPVEMVVATSLSAARAGATEAELADLATRFAAAAEKHPESVQIMQARGELAEVRNRFDEALTFYQELLRRKADYVPAMNNRAWLLALKEDPGGEALTLIDRVLERTGPIANYLDTRAMAYLAAGRPAPATADMEEAIRQEPAAPFYLHLADARLRVGDRTAAAAALREGKNHGLRPEAVHPLERDRCRQMLAEIETR
jgi:cellulose synthase operon protein C